MASTFGSVLGLAVGVAISPVPIIAVILMLFSKAAKLNSSSFLVGWVIGLLLVGVVVLASGVTTSDGAPSTASGWIKVLIGVVFVALGVKQWKGRPRPGEAASVPTWMAKIDDFTAAKAFGIGVLLSAVNPKNLGLTLAAAATIGGSGLSTSEEYVVMLLFVATASSTIATPVIVNLILGSRAAATLTTMKEWLVANNTTVMSVLFVVLGANVFGTGLSILA